jgi:glucosyl-3-phosphoglycerate synthase
MRSPRRFHHKQFADVSALVALKRTQRISVCIPTLNEAETIGEIITKIHTELVVQHHLVDEILVIDSGSTDLTREIATAAGASVYRSAEIMASAGTHLGKGENLWKALHVATGDLICYVDGDISDYHSGSVTGLVGPLLSDDSLDYIKAYYERPLAYGDEAHSTGGGRVSEILIRPLISLFYPELAGILQPLSGEYAARRSTLATLPYPIGYGVEIAHLIDLAQAGKIHQIAQTDLVRRTHRNRDDQELGQMSFAILQVIFRRLQRDGKLTLHFSLPSLYQAWSITEENVAALQKNISEPERPALQS